MGESWQAKKPFKFIREGALAGKCPENRDFFFAVRLGGLGSSLVKSKTRVTFSFTFDLRLGTALGSKRL